MPKYLFYYEKGESVRWLGHLDILRAFERALRRAHMPVTFSLGFNPRLRINFASPLSTGITGSAEPAVIELDAATCCEEIEARLNLALPPGIRIHECVEIGEAGRRDLLNSYDRAEYLFVCASSTLFTEAQAREATEGLLQQSEILIIREREGRTKTVNIRPYVLDLELESINADNLRVSWRTVVGIGESGNVRPAELAGALANRLQGISLRRAHRVRLLRSEEAENFS